MQPDIHIYEKEKRVVSFCRHYVKESKLLCYTNYSRLFTDTMLLILLNLYDIIQIAFKKPLSVQKQVHKTKTKKVYHLRLKSRLQIQL